MAYRLVATGAPKGCGTGAFAMPELFSLAKEGELETVVRDALAWLDKQGIGVFYGRIEHAEGFLHANWDSDQDPGLERFLGLVKLSGAQVVFLDCTICHLRELTEAAANTEA